MSRRHRHHMQCFSLDQVNTIYLGGWRRRRCEERRSADRVTAFQAATNVQKSRGHYGFVLNNHVWRLLHRADVCVRLSVFVFQLRQMWELRIYPTVSSICWSSSWSRAFAVKQSGANNRPVNLLPVRPFDGFVIHLFYRLLLITLLLITWIQRPISRPGRHNKYQ